VGDPAERFREDYLRILRAIRFAARFGFEIESETWAAMRANSGGLAQLSAERVREEWFKGLRGAQSIQRLTNLWRESGAAAAWLPELLAVPAESAPRGAAPLPPAGPMAGGNGSRRGVLPGLEVDRGDHELRDPVLLTVLLCLDPVAVLVRLKASNAEIVRATGMVTGPDAPEGPGVVPVRRWMAAVNQAAEDLVRLWHLRHGAPPPWAQAVRGVRERDEPLTRKQLAVTGEDLRTIGLQPGPAMGQVLERLLVMVVDDPSLNRREKLLELARSIA
jgi:tRNA nucleotidyltransferase (CCA-adding enzyme)